MQKKCRGRHSQVWSISGFYIIFLQNLKVIKVFILILGAFGLQELCIALILKWPFVFVCTTKSVANQNLQLVFSSSSLVLASLWTCGSHSVTYLCLKNFGFIYVHFCFTALKIKKYNKRQGKHVYQGPFKSSCTCNLVYKFQFLLISVDVSC